MMCALVVIVLMVGLVTGYAIGAYFTSPAVADIDLDDILARGQPIVASETTWVPFEIFNATSQKCEGVDVGTALRIVDKVGVQLDLADTAWPMFHHDLQHTGRSPYLGPQTSNVRWSYTVSDAILSSPAIGSDGTLYVGSQDFNLYAINPNGTLKWAFAMGGPVRCSPAIASDGTIYAGIAALPYDFYAINPDGTMKWSYNKDHTFYSSPAIDSNGTIYVGIRGGGLCAINPDGSEKWFYPTSHVLSSPAIGGDGTVYFGSDDSFLYAINPNGTLKWSYATGNAVYSSPAIDSDGTIYVGSSDNKLYAINPNGTLKWPYTAPGSVGDPAIGSDGTIFVGSVGGLYAINPNGTLKWQYASPGGAPVTASAIGSDGTVYGGSSDNSCYAINADGSLKWSFATGDQVYSSPAIGSDGTLYVGSNDRTLYAFGTSLTQPPAVTTSDAINVNATSATLDGNLNTLGTAASVVVSFEYGTATGAYTQTTAGQSLSTATAFSAELSSLTADTKYYFRAKAQGDGEPVYGAEKNFTTTSPPDTTAPIISALTSPGVTTSGASITWTTNEASTSLVQYGLTEQYGSETSLDANLVSSHSVDLTGLQAGKTYHYRVISVDAAGNQAVSPDETFTTLATSGGISDWVWAIIAVALIAAGLVVFILMRRKRKPS